MLICRTIFNKTKPFLQTLRHKGFQLWKYITPPPHPAPRNFMTSIWREMIYKWKKSLGFGVCSAFNSKSFGVLTWIQYLHFQHFSVVLSMLAFWQSLKIQAHQVKRPCGRVGPVVEMWGLDTEDSNSLGMKTSQLFQRVEILSSGESAKSSENQANDPNTSKFALITQLLDLNM